MSEGAEDEGDEALARYRESGDAGALGEAYDAYMRARLEAPGDVPPRLAWQLGEVLGAESQYGDLDDLKLALEYTRYALPLLELDAKRLHTIAGLERDWASRTQESKELSTALGYAQHALELTTSSAPEWADRTATVVSILVQLFETTEDHQYLQRAVSLARDAAVTARGRSRKERASVDFALGVALHTHFSTFREPLSELNETIDSLERSVLGTLPSEPGYAARNADLGRALLTRFKHQRMPKDLDRAVAYRRRALSAVPAGRSDRATFESDLGEVLLRRYPYRTNSGDYEEAITILRAAVASTQPRDRVFNVRRSRLAHALFIGGGRNPARVNEAIDLYQQVVNALPLGSNQRADVLADLVSAMLGSDFKFNLAPSEATLDQILSTDALEPAVAGKLSGLLGRMRRIKFNTTNTWDDLRTAIYNFRFAVDAFGSIAGEEEQRQANWMRMNLAESLQIYTDAPAAVGTETPEAIDLWRALRASPITDVGARCAAAAAVGRITRGAEQRAAYEDAVSLLSQVHGPGLPLSDAHHRLRGFWTIASDAAAAFAANGEPERALELLEQGRSTLLNAQLRLRDKIDRLASIRPDLARDLNETDSILRAPDEIDAVQTAVLGSPVGTHYAALERRQVALGKIRGLDGVGDFDETPKFSELQSASAEGPVVVINVADARCDALIIRNSRVAILPLPLLTAEACRDNALLFVNSVDRLSSREASVDEVERAHAIVGSTLAWLWDAIAEPVLLELGHTMPRTDSDYDSWPRIWWLPTSLLALLPLHAAGRHAGRTEQVMRRDRTVIDRVVSSTLPSLQSLLYARRATPPSVDTRRVLVVAAGNTPANRPLPGALDEAASIEAILGNERCTALTDSAVSPPSMHASRGTVLPLLPSHAWAHFACHSVSLGRSPLESFLLLPDDRTGALTVADIAEADLRSSKLAYFSACTTARRADDPVDEPLHFASAAMMAGYTHAIGTLWPILDSPGAAEAVYRTLAREPFDWTAARSAIAVHDAGRQQRNLNPGLAYKWAAYAHFGP